MGEGKVWLVGAGPGDPGLITVAGRECLRQADVVVYDRLVPAALLKEARPDAELIYVGKKAGAHALPQPEINALLVAKAQQGKRVVRLKGGDPFVFGRGGEESQALAAAGVPFQVVPGVTAAVAVPAYAGIPVSHRGVASSFAVITGHEDATKGESSLQRDRLAAAADTLVFLMGTENLPVIVQQLLAHGRPPDTPAAVIQWGTTPQQRTVTGTLADIVDRVREAGLGPPTVTVVGQVVRLREVLSWYESRPLFGKRVLVTRSRRQASQLSELLLCQGAQPVELPVIEIQEGVDEAALERVVGELEDQRYAWVVFTSANGVEIFFRALRSRGRDARTLAGAQVAAIGPGTAQALARYGLLADLLPDEFVAEGLLAAFQGQDLAGRAVLLPRAQSARPELVEGLRAMGAAVDELALYRAGRPVQPDAEALAMLRRGDIDIVTFTSSSTVRHLAEMLGGDVDCLRKPLIACIGPVTAQTVRKLGLRADVVAQEHTIAGLVAAVRDELANTSSVQG